ncbi:MAG: FemAB family PEP-CTERM system-associated protein [Acidobacteriota bacterium]|nr:MAG: FemAB family PEP-CTERM system-associated protein [Acidobacteriota bacterium]
MDVRVAGANEHRRWDEYVSRFGGDARYHRWKWKEIFARAFRLRTHYLLAERGGSVCGALPLVRQANLLTGVFWTSLPFVNYGGILADDDHAAAALRDEAKRLVGETRAAYAELRSIPACDQPLPASNRKIRAVLDLPCDPDQLWKSFRAKLRSQIRRPMKEGITISVGRDELLEDFYRIVSLKWRQFGSPIYRKRAFETIATTLPEETTILRAELDGKPIGACWLYRFQDSSEIIWAATLRQYDRLSANMLLYWEALKISIEQGCRRFDFGRSTRDCGTHRFKAQWNTEIEDLPWHYVLGRATEVPDSALGGRWANGLRIAWRRAPLFATRLFGQALARRVPL